MGAVLEFFNGLHPWAVYVVLGLGAAIENVLPPIPADTFVVLGGFLAAQGRTAVLGVFLATWMANAGGALLVYEVGRRRGEAFFRSGGGRHLLSAGQLETVDQFYRRWGVSALVFTRFLPGLRAVVPVFAGVSKEPLRRVAPPIFVASAIWYGALVWAGASAQGNIEEIEAWLGRANRGFLAVALVVSGALLVWWYRSRRRA